jgi:hypothetical protein
LSISEDDWVPLVTTLGRIKGIHRLNLFCRTGSRDFYRFHEAVNNACSLRKLEICHHGESFPRDASGLSALADALREHTGLLEFSFIDWRSLLEVAQSTALDRVLWALPGCSHLRKLTMINLPQAHSATDLRLLLYLEQWLAVADEIR